MRKHHTFWHASSDAPKKGGLKDERRRVEILGGATFLLFSVVIVGLFLASGFQKTALRSSEVAAVVSAILVDLANGDRVEGGLDELAINPILVAVAQAKANDMAMSGYFAHVSPKGTDPWHWFQEEGYEYEHAGENLAIDFSDSSDVERAWMNSPTHRNNILSGNFTEIGIATAQGMYQGRETTFVVQAFGAPSRAIARTATIATTKVPKDPEIATATAPVPPQPKVQVLGSATLEDSAPYSSAIHTEPASAAELSVGTLDVIPAWGYVIGFPRSALRYAYYALGLLVLLALALETGFEFRTHHRKKAVRAGILLIAMVVLFVVADYAFFVEPVLALIAAS